MGYPPLSEARSNLRIKWYRTPLETSRLMELSKRSDGKAWLQAGGHFGLFLVSGLLVYYFWLQSMWIAFLLSLFVHGTLASFLNGTACHELGHGTVFDTKKLNRAFLYLFSLISWWDPFDYAGSHTHHHRYTLHPEGDRENLLPLHPNVGKTFLLQLFTINLLTQPGRTFGKGGLLSTTWVTILGALGRVGSQDIPSNEWLQALHTDQPGQHRRSIIWSRILLAFHGLVLSISITTGHWVLFLIITCSSFIANWLSYFVALPQHCGLRENVPDFRKSTRSMMLNPVVEFLYWHMNWHIEHHMYAGVPCYNLPKLHREIAWDMPEPRTLPIAWREMMETWQRQQAEPDYQFDTPLPERIDGACGKQAGELAKSIGDLAPDGMK